MSCWRYSVDMPKIYKLWGRGSSNMETLTLLWVLPTGALPGSYSEYQIKNPFMLQAGEGEKEPF